MSSQFGSVDRTMTSLNSDTSRYPSTHDSVEESVGEMRDESEEEEPEDVIPPIDEHVRIAIVYFK